VCKERSERSVTGEVLDGPLGHCFRVGEIELAQTPLVIDGPLPDRVGHESTQRLGLTVGVERQISRPVLYEVLDLLERASLRHDVASASGSSVQRPREPGAICSGSVVTRSRGPRRSSTALTPVLAGTETEAGKRARSRWTWSSARLS